MAGTQIAYISVLGRPFINCLKDIEIMSITNRHKLNPFVAGSSSPLADQRLAKIGYKSTSKNPAKYPSVCVSVPMITELDESQIDRLLPHIVEMLCNAQDGIIRSLYESRDGTLSEVSDDDISVDSCISYLEAESTGGRLTREYLESWFDQMMKENLTVVIATKLGMEELNEDQMRTINQHLAGYKGLISSLAGGKTLLQEHQIKGIQKALEVSSVDDETGKKLSVRLTAMLNRPKIEELLEL